MNNDTIYRQAALDAIEWTWAGKAAFDAIKALPPAQPEPRWTPCTERMPENGERVLGCGRRGGVMIVRRRFDDFMISGRGTIPAPVVAWMPLPEPYKEETE